MSCSSTSSPQFRKHMARVFFIKRIAKIFILVGISTLILRPLLSPKYGGNNSRLKTRMLRGPCNIDELGEDPDEIVNFFCNCRDELRNIIQKNHSLPKAFEKTKETRHIVEAVRRLANAKQTCETRKVASMPMINSKIRISNEHELAYCQLQNTGSKEMLEFLLQINGLEPEFTDEDILGEASWEKFKTESRKAVKLAVDYLDVTLVQHPLTRLVSYYCREILEKRNEASNKKFDIFTRHRNQSAFDMVRDQLPHYRFLVHANLGTRSEQWKFKFYLKIFPAPGREELEEQPQNDIGLGISDSLPSFREFVMEVAYQILKCGDNPDCKSLINADYVPQIDKCDPCSWNFHLIMKSETIDKDFALLRKLVGYDGPEAGPSRRSSQEEYDGQSSNPACRSFEEYMHQLSGEELDLIYTAYHEDFEVFGYEPLKI